MGRLKQCAVAATFLILAACGTKTGETASGAGKPPEAAENTAPPAAAFEQTLELQGIRFKVHSPNESAGNKLTITASGLESDTAPIRVDVDGNVTGAEVADLNVDGSPEIYVYIGSAGGGSSRQVVAYSSNNRKSLSPIYLPPVSETPEAAAGYKGNEDFAVVESTFVRRFPVYADGDGSVETTGKTRQLQYKLKAGEAGWVLKVDRVVEY